MRKTDNVCTSGLGKPMIGEPILELNMFSLRFHDEIYNLGTTTVESNFIHGTAQNRVVGTC